jgi:hypothetical protein
VFGRRVFGRQWAAAQQQAQTTAPTAKMAAAHQNTVM